MIKRLKSAPTCATLISSFTLLGCSSTAMQSPKEANRNAFVTKAAVSTM